MDAGDTDPIDLQPERENTLQYPLYQLSRPQWLMRPHEPALTHPLVCQVQARESVSSQYSEALTRQDLRLHSNGTFHTQLQTRPASTQ